MILKLEQILQKLGLLQPGKIMYIGGSDVLPAPLTPEQERQALAAAAGGRRSGPSDADRAQSAPGRLYRAAL